MQATATTDEPVVEIRGLVKRYGDLEAVQGIDLVVGAGEVVGLLGPNGAGKTTTIEILEGFRARDGGSVRVLGLDPAIPADLARLRTRVGVVLQSTGHYRFLTAREVLAMHAGYHPNPRPVDEVLELVELTDKAGARVRELSGGQLRRLDVGVALVGRPDLVVLDEPTTGFDPAARRRAWKTIANLRDLGTSVLLTTHYMEEAQVLADRLCVMSKGRIVGEGTPAQLARQLRLDARLSFRLPQGLTLQQMPAVVQGADLDSDIATLACPEPTQILAELCGWAVEQGHSIDDLELRTPSLEESYLALTGGDT